jgi:hypothetical protein
MAAAAVIGKILTVAGGVAGATGNLRSGLSRASELKFEAAQAKNNAELARQDMLLAAESGAIDREDIARESLQERGAARGAFAGGNVAVDTGSALEFDISLAQKAAREREQSKDEQALAIHRLEVERQGLLAEAKLKRRGARTAKKSSQLGFVGGILQSAGGAVGSFGGK